MAGAELGPFQEPTHAVTLTFICRRDGDTDQSIQPEVEALIAKLRPVHVYSTSRLLTRDEAERFVPGGRLPPTWPPEMEGDVDPHVAVLIVDELEALRALGAVITVHRTASEQATPRQQRLSKLLSAVPGASRQTEVAAPSADGWDSAVEVVSISLEETGIDVAQRLNVSLKAVEALYGERPSRP